MLSAQCCGDRNTAWDSVEHILELNVACTPVPRFNIKMTSYQYRKSHCGDKTILRPSYLHNGISYTGKTTSLYWIGALADSSSICLYFASSQCQTLVSCCFNHLPVLLSPAQKWTTVPVIWSGTCPATVWSDVTASLGPSPWDTVQVLPVAPGSDGCCLCFQMVPTSLLAVQREHRCPVCSGLFKDVKRHMMDVHGNHQRWPCQLCRCVFRQKRNLKYHVQLKHPGLLKEAGLLSWWGPDNWWLTRQHEALCNELHPVWPP